MKKRVIINMLFGIQILLLFSPSLFLTSCKKKAKIIHSEPTSLSDNDVIQGTNMSDSIIAQIIANENFLDDTVTFVIQENRTIRLISFGEGADYKINPYLIKSYDNDGIELYFDMQNEKYSDFDLNGDDRHYRILWNLLQVDGQNINVDGMEIGESNPSAENYLMEFKFPWKSLGYVAPESGTSIGFDVAVLDNDGNTREALYAWNSFDSQSWHNTSFFGTLILKGSERKIFIPGVAYSNRTDEAPFIDGKIDQIWNNKMQYEFKNVIVGKLSSASDLSGYFETCWDYDNLYILVYVSDNKKSYASVMFDYGWIEDKLGNTIWRMEMNSTKCAGGGLKNRYVDTLLNLNKGSYVLHYITDESNSPDNWDIEPPLGGFYGIRILNID